MFTRLALALVASLALTSAVRAADLPAGTWAANIDGTKGDLVVKDVKDGKFAGVLLGTDVAGTWNGKTITFLSGKDTYEAHLVSEPGEKGQTKYTLTGMRSQQVFNPSRAGTGFNHVAKIGWYAQLTAATPAPTGEIKAEVRGVLLQDGTNVYVSVKRKSGSDVEETRVWVYATEGEWKLMKQTPAQFDGKEVIVTGQLALLPIEPRQPDPRRRDVLPRQVRHQARERTQVTPAG